jgi:hypothetical protein
MKRSLAVFGLLLLPVTVAAAQSVVGSSRGLDRGTRIRISDPGQGTRREGVLVEWRADSALARIDASGEFVVVPPALVTHLEVYDGMRSGSRKGALIGGAFGLGAALLVVLAQDQGYYATPSTGEAIAGVAASTAVYAGLGALIGSAIKKPKWRAFDTAPRVHAVVDPRGGFGLTLRLGF